MQHINHAQIQKHNKLGAELEAHRKSGGQLFTTDEAERKERQVKNFIGCVRKSVHKYMRWQS